LLGSRRGWNEGDRRWCGRWWRLVPHRGWRRRRGRDDLRSRQVRLFVLVHHSDVVRAESTVRIYNQEEK
jgi:hypothetical protein